MAPQENTQAGQRCLLPEGTAPSLDDVLIGRGRRFVSHNTRFYKIIKSELQAYECSAKNKTMKSLIIVRVLKHIKEDVGGRFLKKDKATGRWIVVEDDLARTTIAQAFRDALNTSYRSSKQSKQRRRALAKFSPSPPSSSSVSAMTSVASAAKATAAVAPVVDSYLKRCAGDVSRSQPLTPLTEFKLALDPLPLTQLSNDQAVLNLRSSIEEALDLTDGMVFSDSDFGAGLGPQEDIMESFDGASQFPGASCGDDEDFMMSSSLFDLFHDTNFEGNPFEPTPLREPTAASK